MASFCPVSLVLFLLIFVGGSCGSVQTEPCTLIRDQANDCQCYVKGKGYIDLSPLRTPTGIPVDMKGTSNPLTINFCKPVVLFGDGTVSSTCKASDEASVCQKDTENKVFNSCGKLSQVHINYSSSVDTQGRPGVVLHFTGGASGRQSYISVACADHAPPSFVRESPINSYRIQMSSKSACLKQHKPIPIGYGSGGELSVGSIILLSLFSGFVLYFIVGCVFNKVRRERSGVEMIPHFTFWADLPHLISEGAVFVKEKTCSKSRSSYEHI